MERSSLEYVQQITAAFSHVTIVTLSWRVQTFVVIGRVHFKTEHCKFWSNFEFDRNIVSGAGASHETTNQKSYLDMFLSHGTACQTNTCVQTGITLSTVRRITFNWHILWIVYDYSTLVWARWFKSFPMKDKKPFIIRSQYYGCWWPGDTNSHTIDREDNDLVVPELSGSTPGPRFNIKMSSYQYRKSHCGDKTVVR